MICCEAWETFWLKVRVKLLEICCSIVTWGPRVGLVSVLRPWGSILILLTPSNFWTRLLTVELSASVRIRFEAVSLNGEVLVWDSCADCSRVCPTARRATMSASGNGGSERYLMLRGLLVSPLMLTVMS